MQTTELKRNPFKKTLQEKQELKKVKKDWLKNLKAMDPLITKSKSTFGFKTNDFASINVILDLAQKAKAMINN